MSNGSFNNTAAPEIIVRPGRNGTGVDFLRRKQGGASDRSYAPYARCAFESSTPPSQREKFIQNLCSALNRAANPSDTAQTTPEHSGPSARGPGPVVLFHIKEETDGRTESPAQTICFRARPEGGVSAPFATLKTLDGTPGPALGKTALAQVAEQAGPLFIGPGSDPSGQLSASPARKQGQSAQNPAF